MPIQISKVGHEPAPTRPKTRKNERTFPKSSLRKTARKIEGVRDPTSSPPFKPGAIHILTRKGEHMKRKKIQGTLKNLTDGQIRAKLRAAKMPISDKAPRELAMSILEGGTEAGMIS